ncbi:ubiquitin-associated domain-containing protein 1 [Ochlerotatus camptorhynchus]|uniref:ubiquitin-associated domain-containing protein 1 n=1 Tax=Ochlerotatus camptorhynchus TaxID=644619 RepID=UPI0031D38CFD
MIPWMREKIAERKARWQQSRKQQRDASAAAGETASMGSASSSSVATNASSSSPAGSSLRGSPSRNIRFSSKHHHHHHRHQQQQQQQQATTSADRSKLGTTCLGRPGTSSASECTLSAEEGCSLQRRGRRTRLLRIISPRGGIVCVEVPQECSGSQLKSHALEQFASCSFSLPHFSSDIEQLVGKYKLIRARNRTAFQDGDTLQKLGVRNEEEFLLVVKRTDFMPSEESLKGPTIAEVLAATKHIPLSRTSQATANFNVGMLQTDLQQDLRRILISLARASAFVIGPGTCAEKLLVLFNQRLTNRRRHQVRSIDTLLEMGFSLDKIHQAMEITKNVFPAALDWLIQNDSSVKLLNCDTSTRETTSSTTIAAGSANNEATTSGEDCTIDTNLPPLAVEEQDIEEPVNTSYTSSRCGSPIGNGDDHDGESATQQQGKDELARFSRKIDHVDALLEIIRQYSDRDVYPAAEMVVSIVEMGFNENSVREALVATRNNQAAACEWLLGNRSKSLTELRDGLPQDSPILQVLLASPQVQISLGNPKMFIALLSMLDNSSTMTMWLSDNDISSVLGHILRTYHEEKHIVAINQFNNAQSFN